MGRSRKDSRRRITIGGVVYRYTISPDDGFVALIARPEDVRGQRLWVKFSYHDDWVPVGGGAHRSAGHRLILPRVVRLAILDGLRRGWNPSATEPALFGLELTWIAIHGALIYAVARWLRAPMFYLAVGSEANIGGAASAPIVAAAFHPVLAPVGVLFAVLGYALGTYGGWLTGLLMRMVAGQ